MRYTIEKRDGASQSNHLELFDLDIFSDSPLEKLGLKHLRYEREKLFGVFDQTKYSYLVEFCDATVAESFYGELQRATAAYNRGYDNLSCAGNTISIKKFPVFMAAYVILAANPIYNAPREALAEFRQKAHLGALPQIEWIIVGVHPGCLERPADGRQYWEMTSVIEATKALRRAAAEPVPAPTQAMTRAEGDRFVEAVVKNTVSVAASLRAGLYAQAVPARRVDPAFDQNLFLGKFTENQSLIHSAQLHDRYVFTAFEFPETTDRKELEVVSDKLTAAGIKNAIKNPYKNQFIQSSFEIQIHQNKQWLMNWLQSQGQTLVMKK